MVYDYRKEKSEYCVAHTQDRTANTVRSHCTPGQELRRWRSHLTPGPQPGLPRNGMRPPKRPVAVEKERSPSLHHPSLLDGRRSVVCWQRWDNTLLFPAVEHFVGLVPRVLHLDEEHFLLELVLV